MRHSFYKPTLLSILWMICIVWGLNAQNRNFMVSLSLGAGNSSFNNTEAGEDEISSIYYPTGGLQIQKRINDKWAINLYPNVGMSGNKRVFNQAQNNITEARSTSRFVNLAIHPKYYLSKNLYVSAGPEASYLMSNFASLYNEDERILNINETKFFNRLNLLVSSSLGISKKIEESRKDAPVQIDCLWFLELRIKKGIGNILDTDALMQDLSTSILSFELVTGFSFATQN